MICVSTHLWQIKMQPTSNGGSSHLGGCPSPTAMSAPYSPGVFRTLRAMGWQLMISFPGSGISWRRAWQPNPVLPGESHGQRAWRATRSQTKMKWISTGTPVMDLSSAYSSVTKIYNTVMNVFINVSLQSYGKIFGMYVLCCETN